MMNNLFEIYRVASKCHYIAKWKGFVYDLTFTRSVTMSFKLLLHLSFWRLKFYGLVFAILELEKELVAYYCRQINKAC